MNDEDRIESIDPESGVFEEYSTGEDGKESEQKSTELKGKRGDEETDVFVVEFPLTTEQWQEDMFEKKIFPASAEFQNLMNSHLLSLFKNLLNSDKQFSCSRQYPHMLRFAKWLEKRHDEIAEKLSSAKPLTDEDNEFMTLYPQRKAKTQADMNATEAFYPNVKRKKKAKQWEYEHKINHECWKYNCSVMNHLVINEKYTKIVSAKTKKSYSPATFSSVGMRSLAGNIIMNEVAKSGRSFHYKGLNLAIARGVADRVWLAWQKKAALGRKDGFKNWGKRIWIDGELNDVDSVKFQNGGNFNHAFVFSSMTLNLYFPGYQGKTGKDERSMSFKLKDRKRSDWLRLATEDFKKPVKEATIVRRPHNRGYRYFAQFSIPGQAPAPNVGPVVPGTVGIDIGTGGFTMWGDTKDSCLKKVILNTKRDEKKISDLQRALDRSDRANNPDCYEADGTLKKGAKVVHTKSGERIVMRLASLRRSIKERIKNEKGCTINHEILPKGDRFIFEKTNSSAWAKRSSKPVGPNGKKKRFGKSVGQFGPSDFIARLSRRAAQTGRAAVEVSTQNAATQFDPITQTFTKHPVEERVVHWGPKGEHPVDRDLAAAFNLAHLKPGAETASTKSVQNYYVNKMLADVNKLLEDQRILESMKKGQKTA